jgi:hypothetical protein
VEANTAIWCLSIQNFPPVFLTDENFAFMFQAIMSGLENSFKSATIETESLAVISNINFGINFHFQAISKLISQVPRELSKPEVALAWGLAVCRRMLHNTNKK